MILSDWCCSLSNLSEYSLSVHSVNIRTMGRLSKWLKVLSTLLVSVGVAGVNGILQIGLFLNSSINNHLLFSTYVGRKAFSQNFVKNWMFVLLNIKKCMFACLQCHSLYLWKNNICTMMYVDYGKCMFACLQCHSLYLWKINEQYNDMLINIWYIFNKYSSGLSDHCNI